MPRCRECRLFSVLKKLGRCKAFQQGKYKTPGDASDCRKVMPVGTGRREDEPRVMHRGQTIQTPAGSKLPKPTLSTPPAEVRPRNRLEAALRSAILASGVWARLRAFA
jgi:hypothetical protein